jgi:hypothetical protein
VNKPQGKPEKMRRNASMALGVTAILASALLTGCAPNGDVIDADYAKVCRDSKTQQRTEDKNCNSESGRSGGAYGWYFLPMGSSGRSVPGVGQSLAGGTDSIPSSASSKSGITPKGSSSVSRGGFGGSAKGGSSTGG